MVRVPALAIPVPRWPLSLWPLRDSAPGRALGWFWLAVLTATLGVAATLQALGPPHGQGAHAPAHADRASAANASDTGSREPAPGLPGLWVPRIAASGRTPMRAYAAPFDASDHRPRVGVLLLGLGLSRADSETAIATLPGAITFGFSPYARDPAVLLASARERGHEYLISLALEPRNAPLDDAGDLALLASAAPERNHQLLLRTLARFGGYVGATGALGALRGERFANFENPMQAMLRELAGRGLLYVDPRPGAAIPEGVTGVAADVLIDAEPGRVAMDRQLRALEETARARGRALGLAAAPLPLTVGALTAWAAGLAGKGLVLAPVSALTTPAAVPEPHAAR